MYCGSGSPVDLLHSMPIVKIVVNGLSVNALIDSGSARTMVASNLCGESSGKRVKVIMMNGRENCTGSLALCKFVVSNRKFEFNSVVVPSLVDGVSVLVGWDMIQFLGGVTFLNNKIRFGFEGETSGSCAGVVEENAIEDDDFSAVFDGQKWVVKWKWCGDLGDMRCSNVPNYKVDENLRESFEREVEEWIELGWLREYIGECKQVLPLLAVSQPSKNKVRPVLDYRHLNNYVSSHTGESLVCAEKIRKWRQMGTNVKLLDLKKAYLQIHLDESLWPYQIVSYKGKRYCLTRLGFGLNSAPKIMCSIVQYIIDKQVAWKGGVDFYIDDIFVNQDIVVVEDVVNHFRNWGLCSKPPEDLINGRVLGLKVFKDGEEICWGRDGEIPNLVEPCTKRQLFSWCGKLIGHYPVGGWIRLATSYIKRNVIVDKWDDFVNESVYGILKLIKKELALGDPVQGVWNFSGKGNVKLWCDASSFAMGVLVEVDEVILEDAAWLRPKNDNKHINNVELEAVLKGLSLMTKWGFRRFELITDSVAVYNWVRLTITKDKRIKASGMSEPLIRRRLEIIKDTVKEWNLSISVTLVSSSENRADRLTRLPKKWLSPDIFSGFSSVETPEPYDRKEFISRAHNLHHAGSEKTLFHVNEVRPGDKFTIGEVREVVQACNRCRSIDPRPETWSKGTIDVDSNWFRLAIDEVHYLGESYLSVVDCGPSRYAFWKKLSSASSDVVCNVLDFLFCVFGPPNEILLDNATIFRSNNFSSFAQNWGVKIIYRCAYRPSGNAIVERNHRTIKSLATRAQCSIQRAVFWYNLLPKDGSDGSSSPSALLFHHRWSVPGTQITEENHKSNKYIVGQRVFVKPGVSSRCDEIWPVGIVTRNGVGSQVEVNGVPRHVADVRSVIIDRDEESVHSDAENEAAATLPFEGAPGRPQRNRRAPQYLEDYVIGDQGGV